MAAWVAPAIEAAGAIATSATSGLFGYNQAKKNRAFQERMYDKQVEDNRKNWEMVNQYNLPSAVMQRMLDAGLNPALMYSDGASNLVANSAAQGGSLPSGATGSAQFVNPFQGFTESYARMKALDAEIENKRSDTALKLAQAITEGAHAANLGANTKKTETETDFNVQSMSSRLRQLVTDINVKESQRKLNEELAKTEPEKRRTLIAQQKELSAQCNVLDKQVEDLDNQIQNRDKITQAQVEKMYREIDIMAEKASHEMALMDAQARKYAADAYIAEIDGAIKSMPEWQAAQLYKELGDAKEALYNGNQSEIKAVIMKYTWDTMPKYNEDAQSYRNWLHNWVNPTTESFGRLISPALNVASELLK